MAPKKPIKTITTPKPDYKAEQKPQPKPEKKVSNPNEPSSWQKFKLFITDERTRIVLGILVAIGVLFLFVSFISYFFTGAADQSKMDLTWREMQQMRTDIHNWASVSGAILAETFINKWFGISSFAILYFGIVLSLRLIKVKFTTLWEAFFHSSFWLVWVSVLLGFIVSPFYEYYTFNFSFGGKHGDEVSKWLVSYVGFPGTIMLLIGTLLVYSIVSSKATIPFLKGLFTKKVKAEKVVAEEPIIYDEDDDEYDEATVAVGTEIIPEDWIVKGAEHDEELIIETEPITSDVDDVPFEIQQPVDPEVIKAVEVEDSESLMSTMKIPIIMWPNWVSTTQHWIYLITIIQRSIC